MADNIGDIGKDIINKFKALDGKIVGEDMQPSKIRLAKDNKGAVVNDVVDKYLMKELTNEYLEEVKVEYNITARDIVREIAKREIQKALGI